MNQEVNKTNEGEPKKPREDPTELDEFGELIEVI